MFRGYNLARWEKRFGLCLVLASGVVLLVGTRDVTRELVHGSAGRDAVPEELRVWSRLLARELGAAPGAAPIELSSEEAVLIIKSSTHTSESTAMAE